jgi:hypothetical protein
MFPGVPDSQICWQRTGTLYNTKLTQEESYRVSHGDFELLKTKLKESDKQLVKALKANKNPQDIAFLQGASSVIDKLIEILEI